MMKTEVASRRARIVHRDGVSRFRTEPAQLIDISEQGAHLVCGVTAVEGQAVWFGLEALPCEWVRATVGDVVQNQGECRYHVTFREPCPVGILEAATQQEYDSALETLFTFSFELD